MPGAKLKSPGNPASYDPDYPLVAETLGLWRLTRGLGRGGMGEVYQGEYDFLHLLTLRYKPEERGMIRRELAELPREEQARLASELLGTPLEAEAQFAIKVCSARSGTAGHRRFIQEAELAKRLGDHPYVVTVHSLSPGDGSAVRGSVAHHVTTTGRHQDVAFMVMDLAAREYDHTRLSITESVHIVRCIALALDHAHSHGIVHRDLKPENILGGVEHPYLTDFGIAKELDQSLGLTRTGQIIGTLDYMSPEQATDAKNVDHRSDIYSLGLVLYEMSTRGQLPYIHLSEREAALSAIRSERIESKWPRDHVPDFPRGLERIILKATAHRPDERYQEMSDMIRDLDRYGRGEWIPAITHVSPKRMIRHLIQAHPKLSWGLPLVLVAMLVAWLVILMPEWLDKTRQYYDAELQEYARVVEQITSGHQQQLSLEQRERIMQLANRLTADQENYSEQYQRLQQLDQQRRLSRYLKIEFTGLGDEDREAKDELQLAAGVNDPNWRLVPDGGLLTIEHTVLRNLRPYGDGQLVVIFDAELREPEGFVLEVTESDEARSHTQAVIENGELVLRFLQDRLPPEEIHRRPFAPGGRLYLYLIIDDAGVRAYVPQRLRPLRAVALTPGSPGRVRLELPRGTILRNLQIWPKKAQPENARSGSASGEVGSP